MIEELKLVTEMLNGLGEVGMEGFIYWLVVKGLTHLLWAFVLGALVLGAYKLIRRAMDQQFAKTDPGSELRKIKKAAGLSTYDEASHYDLVDLEKITRWIAPYKTLSRRAMSGHEAFSRYKEAYSVFDAPFNDVVTALKFWKAHKETES